METVKVTSDRRRQQFLNTSTRYLAKCMENNDSLPFGFLTDRLAPLRDEFNAAMKGLIVSHSVWRKKSGERLALNEELSQCARDFVNVLKRRTARYKHDDSVLSLYKVPTDGNFPHPTQLAAWEVIANLLIEGEEVAVAQGFEPMNNPPISEIQMHLDKIKDAEVDVRLTLDAKTARQKTLQKLRLEVDDVKSKLFHMLTGWWSHEKASTRRQLMRSFGFEFSSSSQPDLEEEVETPLEETQPAVDATTVESKKEEDTTVLEQTTVATDQEPLRKVS